MATMKTETSTQKTPVIHQLQHAAQQYRIITADEEIIPRTGEQIVRACKLEMSASAWAQNFDLMAKHVHEWCNQQDDKVALALVELRSDKTVFFIIPRSEEYDFALGRSQARLDIHLNTRGGIGYAETRQIPMWEIERFVAPTAFRVFPVDDEVEG
jgi:hypothetical protein